MGQGRPAKIFYVEAISNSIARNASAAGGRERPAFSVSVIGRRRCGLVMRREGRPGSSSSSIALEGRMAMPRPARTKPMAVSYKSPHRPAQPDAPVGEGPIDETTYAALGIHQDQRFVYQPAEHDLGLFAKRMRRWNDSPHLILEQGDCFQFGIRFDIAANAEINDLLPHHGVDALPTESRTVIADMWMPLLEAGDEGRQHGCGDRGQSGDAHLP